MKRINMRIISGCLVFLGLLTRLGKAQESNVSDELLIPVKQEKALTKIDLFRHDYQVASPQNVESRITGNAPAYAEPVELTLHSKNKVPNIYSFASSQMSDSFGIWLEPSVEPVFNEKALEEAYRREAATRSQAELRAAAASLIKKYSNPSIQWKTRYERFPIARYFTNDAGKQERIPSIDAGIFSINLIQDIGNGMSGPSKIQIKMYRDSGQLIELGLEQSPLSKEQVEYLYKQKSAFPTNLDATKFEFLAAKDPWLKVQLFAESDSETLRAKPVGDSTTWQKLDRTTPSDVELVFNSCQLMYGLNSPLMAFEKSVLIDSDYFPGFLIDVSRSKDRIMLKGRLPEKGKNATLTVGRKSATIDGKTVSLSTSPQEISGQLYLPYELLTLCNGVPTRYEPKKKTLHVETRYLRQPDANVK